MPENDGKNVVGFKSAGMKRAGVRDANVSKGKEFGIGNFFAWAMEKYPKLTLGQLETKMPQLEREYGQEKAMRKAQPDQKPTVTPAFDDEKELNKAKGIEVPDAFESEMARIKELAGLEEGPGEYGYTLEYNGERNGYSIHKLTITSPSGESKEVADDFTYFEPDEQDMQAELESWFKNGHGVGDEQDESINEDEEVTKDVIGHRDNEPDMIRKELYKMGKYSVELYRALGELPNGDFPHWWQAKIVKAGKYLSNAKHYLDAELNAPEPEALEINKAEVEQEDLNPSGV